MSQSLPAIPGTELLGTPVRLSRIEKELQNLFMGETAEENSDGSNGIAKASLLNLALYNENQNELAEDAAALEELTQETACRAILIHTDSKAENLDAHAWIQAHCRIGGNGKKQVCTEQLSFVLEGDAAGLVRNIVFSNLDSDLPLAFWWRGELSDTLEERLYSRIDRLIFDSESWESPRNQFLRLQEAEKSTPEPFVAHDLAYTRINSIRQAIANTFDRPNIDNRIETIQKITIRTHAGCRMSAIYLAAWIASRLGITLDGKASSSDKFVFSGKGNAHRPDSLLITIEALDEARKGNVEVDFEMGNQRIEISRCQSKDFIRTRIHSDDSCLQAEDWLPKKGSSDPELVTEILRRAGRNRAYGMVLPMARELIAL